MKDAAFVLRNRANENRERLAIADQLTFWRGKCELTSCPLRLASYRRIISDLRDLAERMEAANG